MKKILLKCVGGRYPFALARHDRDKIRATLVRDGAWLVLRIDDTSNIDRWEEFTVNVSDIAGLLVEQEYVEK